MKGGQPFSKNTQSSFRLQNLFSGKPHSLEQRKRAASHFEILAVTTDNFVEWPSKRQKQGDDHSFNSIVILLGNSMRQASQYCHPFFAK